MPCPGATPGAPGVHGEVCETPACLGRGGQAHALPVADCCCPYTATFGADLDSQESHPESRESRRTPRTPFPLVASPFPAARLAQVRGRRRPPPRRCRSLPLAEAHGALRLRLPGPAPHLAASAPRQCDGPCFRRRRQFGGVLDWRFGECFPAWVWAGGGRHICPLGSSPSAGLTECASFPAVSPSPHSLFPFGRESPCTVPVSGWGFSFPSRRGEQRRDLPVWEESFARSSPCDPQLFLGAEAPFSHQRVCEPPAWPQLCS